MKREYDWWFTLGEKSSVKLNCKFSCWNPLDEFELKRSIRISRLNNQSVSFISIIIAFIFVKFEWHLYIK